MDATLPRGRLSTEAVDNARLCLQALQPHSSHLGSQLGTDPALQLCTILEALDLDDADLDLPDAATAIAIAGALQGSQARNAAQCPPSTAVAASPQRATGPARIADELQGDVQRCVSVCPTQEDVPCAQGFAAGPRMCGHDDGCADGEMEQGDLTCELLDMHFQDGDECQVHGASLTCHCNEQGRRSSVALKPGLLEHAACTYFSVAAVKGESLTITEIRHSCHHVSPCRRARR